MKVDNAGLLKFFIIYILFLFTFGKVMAIIKYRCAVDLTVHTPASSIFANELYTSDLG